MEDHQTQMGSMRGSPFGQALRTWPGVSRGSTSPGGGGHRVRVPRSYAPRGNASADALRPVRCRGREGAAERPGSIPTRSVGTRVSRPAFAGRALLLLLGIAVWTMPAVADTYPRQPGVDALHYTFRMTLNDDTDEIEGEATIDLKFVKDGVGEFALDLASAKGGKGMTVSAVTSAGETIKYAHEADRLKVTLDAPKVGESRSFTVKYRGVPASGLRVGPNKFKERTFFSDNWPDKARQWLPTIDHPYDKATSEFLVTAPARYQVVSNGLLIEETDLGDGRRITHWKQSVPIAAWLNALGVAQFTSRHAGSVKGVPLEVWSFHQDGDKGRIAFEDPARRVMEFYIDKVGPFPYEKLGNVEAAGISGGMELASAIFYGEGSVNGRPATDLVAHEVAHQWFGDAVTERDWDDVWLSEGFATYFTLLFAEHDRGREAFVAGLKRSRTLVLGAETQNPGLAVIHDNLADTTKVLNTLVYQKGGWTLHMLRKKVGTEAFWAGIRAYYQRHRDGNVSTDDFRRAMEEASGQDLAPFFRQWLTRAGSPSIVGTWSYDKDAKKLTIELTQVQSGEPYLLPIEVLSSDLRKTSQPRVERVDLSRKQQTFEFEAETEPTSVVLDPETWVLMRSRIQKR
jgi:aminopeptidase N